MRPTASACQTVLVDPVVSRSGAERCDFNSSVSGPEAFEAKPSFRQEGSTSIPTDGLGCPPIGSDELCFLDWVDSCLNFLWSTRTGLGHFLRTSTVVPACPVVPGVDSSGDVWSVPLPHRLRWTARGSKPNPQRRRRLRMRRVAWDLVRLQVGCLNWLSLGCPIKAPAHACTGAARLRRAQLVALDTLERNCLHFLRAGRFNSSTLGRSAEKFNLLLRMALELPSCSFANSGDVDRVLNQFVFALQADWNTYSRASKPHGDDPVPQDASAPPSSAACASDSNRLFQATVPHGHKCSVGSGLSCKPVVASRVKWTLPPSFNPLPFLTDPIMKQAFLDPNSLRKSPDLWPSLPRAKVHCSKSELLKLAEKWDKFGALRLFPTSEIDPLETVGCFCVPKDECWDCFILNPCVINSRTHSYSNFTGMLAPGSMLTLAHLPSLSRCMRFCADDLSEMYYTFQVGDLRARRNCIGLPLTPADVCNFEAFSSDLHSCPVYASLGTLAMGDGHAVEFAQQAHFNVLSQLGDCVRPEEFVSYRRVFPRGPTFEFLSIDDHLTAQICTYHEHKSEAPLRDTAIFKTSSLAYPKVGLVLVQHPKKQRRNVTSGIFLGADCDGRAGLISAPRHRVGVLLKLTLILVQRGCCSSSMLSALVGLWIHVLMFRRPMLALLQAVFTDARHEPRDVVFALQRESLNELLSLCILGASACTDIRTSYLPMIYAMDASPSGGGLCCAEVPPRTVQELWRFSEQRGFYTRLLGPASALLSELGIGLGPSDALDSEFRGGLSAADAPLRPSLCRPLQEGILFDVVELFSGSANWTQCHSALGLSAHPGVDIPNASGRMLDFSLDSTFHELCSLALRRVVREWHGGPPCLTYGTLRRPRLRSKRFPLASILKIP